MNRNLLRIVVALLLLPLVGLGLALTPAADARMVAGVCEVRVRDGGVQRWQVVDPSFCAGAPPATHTPTATRTATAVPPTATAPPPTVAPTATATVLPPTATPIAGDCQAAHDAYTTVGPDGKVYPTWHPAAAGACAFGHEHGANPATSGADSSLPAFGYAAAVAGKVEPHVGFKVFVIPAGVVTDNGTVTSGDYRIVFHMGTSGVGRYTEQFHSLEYDYIARDGSGRYAHLYGLANTGTAIGSTCDLPRRGGRDFSTIGCPDAYEIWGFAFWLIHPDDEFVEAQQVRTAIGGAVAAFDPVTTRDPADNSRLVYTQDYRAPGVDPLSPLAEYRGCKRESYGGPNYFLNAGRPAVYFTDVYGAIQPGPGPGTIRQEVSSLDSRANDFFKWRIDYCGGGVKAPN